MQTVAIIGAQWGDEGKGKITDMLAEKCDYVVRYQGGHNAGHTIWVSGKKTVLHVIPSGVLHAHCVSIIGHGVVFEPENFLKELNNVKSIIPIDHKRLMVSENATVITSYHRLLDAARESQGPEKIGTTGKGIGPAYEDKTARKAVKVKDLLNKDALYKRLSNGFAEKQILFKELYRIEVPTVEQETERLYNLGQQFKEYICDTFSVLDKAVTENKKVLYEGAQGVLLDVDYGTYPYVTSSSTSSAGILTGAGNVKGKVDEILGIVKAYTTRVGEGPMPTELFDSVGEYIQMTGNEVGATTGRKRRCGWLDFPLLRYAIKCSHLTSIALTKLDILSGMNTLKICYAYEIDGKTIDCAYPGIDLAKVKPLFKDLKPFKDNFKTNEISEELQNYIHAIEEGLKIPVGIYAFGPDRAEIKFTKKYL